MQSGVFVSDPENSVAGIGSCEPTDPAPMDAEQRGCFPILNQTMIESRRGKRRLFHEGSLEPLFGYSDPDWRSQNRYLSA